MACNIACSIPTALALPELVLAASSGGNAKAAEQFSAGQLDIEALVEYRSPTTNMGF